MSYQETIDYLYNRLPMFSKQGASAIKKDLVNIKKLCEALGNPHLQFKSIHVAGTNGKGSTSHMLAAVLQKAGYKTGLYTSPHLLDFRERIKINGEMISQEEVIDFVKEHKALFEEIEPSFFEVTVAMAFDYFAKQEVDFAVIETGLGGRLDSTNIIHPLLSVITNISPDHTAILGNTLPEIAREKAGIIKENSPVIISEKSDETAPVFEEIAKEKNSKIIFASSLWETTQIKKTASTLNIQINPIHHPQLTETYELDLNGSYQRKNLIGVLTALDELANLGYPISKEDRHYALAHVKALTGLMGRWQTLAQNPLIICDTGHNEQGWKEILLSIRQQKFNHLHMVIGVMADKDIESLLTTLPKEATYYFCRPNFDRALNENALREQAAEKGLIGQAYPSIADAIKAAKITAQPDDFIFIGGSSFVVAEALESFV
jgi:dihydrofolate synthase/folylpolyglutamate synthase